MKLVALVVTVWLGLISSARAQVASIGAYGGVNHAGNEGARPVTAPLAGVRFQLGLGNSLALGMGVEYSGTGFRVASPGAQATTLDYRAGYLAAPLAVRLQLGQGRIPFHVSAGTTVGTLLFATETMDGAERDVRDQLAPIEATADLGAGFALQLSPRISFDVEGRWSLALIDGVKRDAALDLDSWNARAVQITAGITFTLVPRGKPAMPALPAMPAGWN